MHHNRVYTLSEMKAISSLENSYLTFDIVFLSACYRNANFIALQPSTYQLRLLWGIPPNDGEIM
ncbi:MULTISPECIES: hypothetical protein [Nostocales]|uniref:Uncharacterized protein n=3 Tax=Nostocales TaxID=1161 RepID=A0A8S9SXD0_9CYAN|nr:hypothetical protein [Tolypothrix bouteillei]KAF3883979.1 hypothetical protein DA73_0400040525 [Tolypothrix bouteillei VB521301]